MYFRTVANERCSVCFIMASSPYMASSPTPFIAACVASPARQLCPAKSSTFNPIHAVARGWSAPSSETSNGLTRNKGFPETRSLPTNCEAAAGDESTDPEPWSWATERPWRSAPFASTTADQQLSNRFARPGLRPGGSDRWSEYRALGQEDTLELPEAERQTEHDYERTSLTTSASLP